MARDAQGNNLADVKVPVTGFAAIGPAGSALINAAALADPDFVLPAEYDYLGLFTQDGGPSEENEAGDAIEFFQMGYSLPSGDDSVKETLTLAEDNEAVRRLVYGDEPVDDVYVKQGAVPVGSFPYLRVTRYKNGTELRRHGIVHVESIEPEQETRGEVRAFAVTFAFEYQTDIGLVDEQGRPIGGLFLDAPIDLNAEPDPEPEPEPGEE